MNLENPWLKALCFSLGVHLVLAAFLIFLERPKRPNYQVVRLKLKSVVYPTRKETKAKALKRQTSRKKPRKTSTQKAKKPRKKLLAQKKAPPKTAHKPHPKAQKTRKKAKKRVAAKKVPQRQEPSPKPKKAEEREDLLAKRLAALKAQVEERKLKERLARLKEEASATSGGLSLGSGLSQELAERLMAHLKSFWAVPEVLEDRKDLSAEVELEIAPDGHLVSFRFLRRSGEPLFDEAVVATLKRADPLPAPGRPLTLPAVFKIY